LTLYRAPRHLTPGSFGYLVLAGILTAQAALAMDSLLPALPAIVSELDLSAGAVQLNVAGFMAGFALGQIVWGWTSDWLGRRPIILLGTGGFIFATFMCSLVDSGAGLIAWRAVQGLFSSASMAATRAMLRDHFSGVQLARNMAAVSIVLLATPIIVPQISAALLHLGSWRSVFAIPGLVSFGAFLVFWRALAESHPPAQRRRHLPAAVAQTVAAMLRHPLSSLCLAIQGGMSIGLITWLSAGSLVFTGHYGRTVEFFGLIHAATALVMLTGSIICNQALKRRGAHEVMALGGACCAVGGLGVFLAASVFEGSLWAVAASMWVFMLGFGLTVPSSGGMALHAFGAAGGIAAALVGCSQSLVGSMGSIVSAYLYDGTPRSLGIGVGLAAVVAFPPIVLLSRRLFLQPDLLANPGEVSLAEDIA